MATKMQNIAKPMFFIGIMGIRFGICKRICGPIVVDHKMHNSDGIRNKPAANSNQLMANQKFGANVNSL